jgi:hypothetical protein
MNNDDEQAYQAWKKTEIEHLCAAIKSVQAHFAADRMPVEKLRAERDELLAALQVIADWARAYPLEVFPEPDFIKAAELLKVGGITLDAISASCMRHVVTEVAKIAERAIAKAERK